MCLIGRRSFWSTRSTRSRRGLVPRDVPARPKTLSVSQFADAGVGDLTPYDCVFFCDVPRLSAAEVKRLEAHVRRGGGAIFVLGPHVDRDDYNRLLYRDGKGLLPAKLKEVKPSDEEKRTEPKLYAFHATNTALGLPPLDIFSDDRDRVGLMNVRVRKYFSVEPCERTARARSSRTSRRTRKPPATGEGDDKCLMRLSWPGTRRRRPRAIARASPRRCKAACCSSPAPSTWTGPLWPVSPSYPPSWQN